MSKRFAYTRPDGGMSIVVGVDKAILERDMGRVLSDDEYHERVRTRGLPPDATDLHELPEAWTPPDSDRYFRNAWRKSGMAFTVDMAHAREIHREQMRAVRAPKLDALDVAFMRSLEDGKDTKAIAAKKQALRDVTAHPDIDAAKTPDALRAVWPAALKE